MRQGLPSPQELERSYASLPTQELLGALLRGPWRGRIAVLTSFGAESAVLLDLVARVEPATPVLFLETGMHYRETLAFRDLAVERFRLTNLQEIRPDPEMLARVDPQGRLWRSNTDACCRLRKVVPLRQALHPFAGVITGRKRFHGGQRSRLPLFERFDGRIRINPLATWSEEEVELAMETAGLPRHPLLQRGYRSIGCWPCTRPVEEGEAVRAGRWSGSAKTECGIHLSYVQNGGGGCC